MGRRFQLVIDVKKEGVLRVGNQNSQRAAFPYGPATWHEGPGDTGFAFREMLIQIVSQWRRAASKAPQMACTIFFSSCDASFRKESVRRSTGRACGERERSPEPSAARKEARHVSSTRDPASGGFHLRPGNPKSRVVRGSSILRIRSRIQFFCCFFVLNCISPSRKGSGVSRF